MSAIANITIADGATTPVNHVFAPVGTNPPGWEDTDAAKVYKLRSIVLPQLGKFRIRPRV